MTTPSFLEREARAFWALCMELRSTPHDKSEFAPEFEGIALNTEWPALRQRAEQRLAGLRASSVGVGHRANA